MTKKTNRGCKYNRCGLSAKYNLVFCESEPQHKGYCLKHLPYKLKLEYEHDQVPQDTRQKYLDFINQGKSIGEARELAGISFEAALAITNNAIRDFKYLAKEAV